MEIGSVIREKRTAQGLTQEQVATALGVSAPAVSKWERGESFPEITLLPALARLLGTDLNGLLSFQQEMGREEIAAFLGRLVQAAEEGPQAAFALARAQVGQFPRCDSLALNVALTLEGVLTMAGREGSAEEREWIQALYRQAAESRDQAVACQAQAMLFGRAMEEGDFAQAEALLDRLPPSPCTTGPRWRPAWPRPRGMGTGRDSCWSTSCSNRPAGPRPPCWPCWSWPAGRAAGGIWPLWRTRPWPWASCWSSPPTAAGRSASSRPV